MRLILLYILRTEENSNIDKGLYKPLDIFGRGRGGFLIDILRDSFIIMYMLRQKKHKINTKKT